MNYGNPAGGKYPAKPQAMIGRKSGHPKPSKKCANPKKIKTHGN